MQIESNLNIATEPTVAVNFTEQVFLPLENETRTAIDTAAAAYYLNRKPQTLRAWACLENGPIRPIRIHGRLAWAVSDLRNLLGLAHAPNSTTSAVNLANRVGAVSLAARPASRPASQVTTERFLRISGE